MANEFVHASQGSILTQAEFEAVGLHVLNSQARGDMVYASSASQLSRLAVGAANAFLQSDGTDPVWRTSLVIGGAINFNSQNMTNVDIDSGTISTVTLDGTVTTNNQYFDAGSGDFNIVTASDWRGLRLQNNVSGSGAFRMYAYINSSSPAGGDSLLSIMGKGKSDTAADVEYSEIRLQIEDATNGNHAGKMEFHNHLSGSDNLAMRLSGAGGLGVDADIGTGDDPVALFDDYDDAVILQQSIQQRNADLLADMGIYERKDSGSGYLMNIQPMIRLLAGGIYQTRDRIDRVMDIIAAEFPEVGKRLEERGLLISRGG